MRKLLVIGIVLLCTSCIFNIPREVRVYYDGTSYIKNCTEQTLSIEIPAYLCYNNVSLYVIPPRDSVQVDVIRSEYKTAPNFEEWIEHGRDVSSPVVKIYSEAGDVLKQYRYSDKEMPGKQFFDEQYWHHYYFQEHDTEFPLDVDWVFDIFPEDIRQN